MSDIIERLARYMDPEAFRSGWRSSRNAQAARNARKYAVKQAKAAIRFLSKPEIDFTQAQAIADLTAERDALREAGQGVLTHLEAADWHSSIPELNGPMHEAIQHLRASLGQRNTMGIPITALKGDPNG